MKTISVKIALFALVLMATTQVNAMHQIIQTMKNLGQTVKTTKPAPIKPQPQPWPVRPRGAASVTG